MKRWPLHKAHFWEAAPFFRILLPFAAGIMYYDRQIAKHLLPPFSILITVGLLAVYGCLLVVNNRRRIYPGILFAVLQALLFTCGISAACFSDVRNNSTWFGSSIGHGASHLVRVTDAPIEKERSWKVPVSVLQSVSAQKIIPKTGQAQLYLYKDMQPMMLHKGDTIWVPDKWQTIHNAGNPFEFDYAGYCSRNNLFYQQYCSVKNIRLYATNDPNKGPIAERAHSFCMQQLDIYLEDYVAKGLIQAMLLGDEVNLDDELKQSYAATGIIHIIAISGGNVMIFFSVISVLLWWLKNKRHVWLKYALALPLVWFYVVMAGAPPSAVRAAIMFSLLAFAVMFQKNNSNLNTLFATAFVLLCWEPMWLFSIGFQLSFTAVLSLILFYKPFCKLATPKGKVVRILWSTVAASIAAEILTAPLVLYYFHTFPLLFVIANVAAYVFMGVVLVMGMLIITVSFIPAIATVIGIAASWLVATFDRIVTWLQGFNPDSFRFLMLTTAELFMLYATITGIAIFLMRKHKAGIFIGLISSCLLVACLCRDEWECLRQRAIIVYNTSKGNHAELISGKRYSVICTDTVIKKTEYATNAAHTYLHAWRRDKTNANEILALNGKTFLVLNDSRDLVGQFPVDYLLINTEDIPDVAALKRTFSPALTIIGNNYSRKQQADLLKEFSANDAAVFAIARDGAFVLCDPHH